MKRIEIFTDGSCLRNPGPGGWAAILRYKENEKEISGSKPETTNNQMELTAVIMALKNLKEKCNISLYTDSKYVIDGITNWIETWKRNDWKTANKKAAVKNIDLWQTLDEEASKHEIRWIWVKGHDGHPENERVDILAKEEANRISK